MTQTQWNANDGNSNYNAMLVGIRHGFSRWFQFEADYRWSKLMDNASQPYYLDPYMWNPKASWGPADYDVRQCFQSLWRLADSMVSRPTQLGGPDPRRMDSLRHSQLALWLSLDSDL